VNICLLFLLLVLLLLLFLPRPVRPAQSRAQRLEARARPRELSKGCAPFQLFVPTELISKFLTSFRLPLKSRPSLSCGLLKVVLWLLLLLATKLISKRPNATGQPSFWQWPSNEIVAFFI